MPFSEKVGLNCGFCYTLVCEHCVKIEKNHGDTAGKKKSEEASGKKNEGDNSDSLLLNFTEIFKLYFQGPRFTVGDGYFVRSKG